MGQASNTTGAFRLHVTGAGIATTGSELLNSTAKVRLPAGAVHLYKITLKKAGTLSVFTTGRTDTYGELYDANGAWLTADGSAGGYGNFHITIPNRAAGTYYIRVMGQAGSTTGIYSLFALHKGLKRPIVTTLKGKVVPAIRSLAWGAANGRLIAGAVDTYQVTLTRPGTLSVFTTGATDTHGQLYDANGAWLTADSSSGGQRNFHITRIGLTAGTYYIRVMGQAGSTTGAYKVYALNQSVRKPALNVKGLRTNGVALGDAITAGSVGRIYRIYLQAASSNLKVTTQGTTDTYGELYDANGSYLASASSGGVGSNFSIAAAALPRGIYYVKVMGQAGSTAGPFTISATLY